MIFVINCRRFRLFIYRLSILFDMMKSIIIRYIIYYYFDYNYFVYYNKIFVTNIIIIII